MMFASVDPSTPVTLLYELAEKSYMINEVGAVGNGLGTWVSLSPVGTATAAQGPVVLSLQGTQQLTSLSGLVGQPVSFGPVPTVFGSAGKYVAFYPAAGMSSDGIAAGSSSSFYGHSGEAASHPAMLKLSGSHSADQVLGHSGKAYTVVKTKVAAGGGSKLFLVESCDAAHKVKDILVINVKNGSNETATLIGKSFTFGKAPAAAGGAGGKYILLKPATGAAGKAAAGTALAGKGALTKGAMAKGAMTQGTMTTGAMTKGAMTKGAAMQAAAPGGAVAGHGLWWQHIFGGGAVPGAQAAAQVAGGGAMAAGGASVAAGGAAVAAKSAVGKTAAVAAGTLWPGAGVGLGLGAGPLIVVALAVATAYGIGRYRKQLREVQAET